MSIAECIKQRLHVNDHPLVKAKMTMLRNETTGSKEFRELAGEIAAFIAYEATRDVEIAPAKVKTPVAEADGWKCVRKFSLVPILRAGVGMVESISNLLPTAKIGHIGLYRNPDTLHPVEYYSKLPPELAECEVLLLDPMLATGRTAAQSIQLLKNAGAVHIKFLCLVAVKEGVEEILSNHPDVNIYTAAYDQHLNEHGYIVPGLGDAGDRLFGTR
ncbi:MAG: uracil phosphoribosyltransferase [Defluviitaleaceae bacterium]|nr:uracil phosphoribosyltransferase [Defluviitaleaceae bacterium]